MNNPVVFLAQPACKQHASYFITAKRGESVVFADYVEEGNLFLAMESARRSMIAQGIATRKDLSSLAVRFTHVCEQPERTVSLPAVALAVAIAIDKSGLLSGAEEGRA